MGLINPSAKVTADQLEFQRTDLRDMPERRFRALRCPEMETALQDPRFSLNAIIKIDI